MTLIIWFISSKLFRGYRNPGNVFKKIMKVAVMLFKGNYKTKHGKGLEILTPKKGFEK